MKKYPNQRDNLIIKPIPVINIYHII